MAGTRTTTKAVSKTRTKKGTICLLWKKVLLQADVNRVKAADQVQETTFGAGSSTRRMAGTWSTDTVSWALMGTTGTRTGSGEDIAAAAGCSALRASSCGGGTGGGQTIKIVAQATAEKKGTH